MEKERGPIMKGLERATETVAKVSVPIDVAATGIFFFFGNLGYAALLAGKTVLDWGIWKHFEGKRLRPGMAR